jgi:trans-aconitate methyltransferase
MSDSGWQEPTSQLFIDFGEAFTPSRTEQAAMMTSLIPAAENEEFLAVDLACGAGWLGEAVLRHFPRSRVIALDGSPAMLDRARASLEEWQKRVELRRFDLPETRWLDELPDPVRCFMSSLAIHHLDGRQKQNLFRRLREKLSPGGAFLVADLVEPIDDLVRRAYALAWDDTVKEQSEKRRGDLGEFEEFRKQEWNLYQHPDPDFDKPSNLFDQLIWLREAGFSGVDCFWLRAGHAIYGGYV